MTGIKAFWQYNANVNHIRIVAILVSTVVFSILLYAATPENPNLKLPWTTVTICNSTERVCGNKVSVSSILNEHTYSAGCHAVDVYNKSVESGSYQSKLAACGNISQNKSLAALHHKECFARDRRRKVGGTERFKGHQTRATHSSRVRLNSKKSRRREVEETPMQPLKGTLVSSQCDWRKYTYTGALKLLRGRHLVLCGDSRIRYQYLSFTYWLVNGIWPEDTVNALGHMPVTNEHFWDGHKQPWFDFYTDTNAYLRGYEECDCYRPRRFVVNETFENRYFHMHEHNVRITYMQSFDGENMRGHNGFSALGLPITEPHCGVGACEGSPDWNQTYTSALTELFPRMNATDIFFHSGWNPKANMLRTMTSMAWENAVATATTNNTSRGRPLNVYVLGGHSGSNAYTKHEQEWAESDPIKRSIGNGAHYIDLYTVSKIYDETKVRWDGLHFHAWVYSEFSQLFLNALANI